MKTYIKKSSQNLPITLEEAWDFISDPENLRVLTPPAMRIKILSGAQKPLASGQIIDYSITPLFGIRTKWVTEISDVKEGYYFVDVQKAGPYALWKHQHLLKEIPGGVEMQDIIDYQLPLGILGQLAHPFLVRPKLYAIFEYRRKKLIELFGEYKS